MSRALVRSRFVVVVLLLAAAACKRDPQAASAAFVSAGDRYVEAKNDSAAIIEFRNALQLGDAGETRLKLGLAYLRSGDIVSSLAELVRAADLLPERDDVQLSAARVLMLGERFPEARVLAERVIRRSPADASAHVLLGSALAGLREPAAALKQMEESVRLAPENPTSYVSLGALHVSQNDRASAERAFRQAIAIAPDSPYPHLALAQFHWTGDSAAKAEPEVVEALRLGSGEPLVARFAAAFYETTARPELAEPLLVGAAAADPLPGSKLELARFYIAQRRWDNATTVLEGLRSDPEAGPAAALQLARVALAAGKVGDAETMIDQVISKDGESADALLVKSAIFFARNKPAEALAAVDAALRRAPSSAEANFIRGRLLVSERRTKEAQEAFSRVLTLNPRAVGAQVELARLYLAGGSTDSAVGLADSALRAEPGNLDAQLVLARSLLARGSLAAAEDALTSGLAAAPNSAALQATMGSLRAMQGNPSAARRAWEAALTGDARQVEAIAGITGLDISEGRTAAALSRVDALVEQNPGDATMLMVAGRTHALAGGYPAAQGLLTRAIEADAGLLPAYDLLGQIYIRENRLNDAQRQFETLATHEDTSVSALTMVGMLQQAQGRILEAETSFEKVLGINPRSGVAANNLAWLLVEQQRDLDRALDLARAAKAALPHHPAVDDTLGWVYVRKGMTGLAIASLERAVADAPGNPTYRYHLAAAYAQAKDTARAKSLLREALSVTPAMPDAASAERLLSELEILGSRTS